MNFAINFTIVAKGIIIANDDKFYEMMNSNDAVKWEIFKNNIKNNYDEVIIHLGSRFAFIEGGMFASDLSQNKLVELSNFLKSNKISLYLWFLDGHGSIDFLKIYREYKQIIDANLNKLKELEIKYSGIVLDLEWINEPNTYNNIKLIEICEYASKTLGGEHKLFLFASLNENNIENIKRGYLVDLLFKHIDGFIGMVYPRDGGIDLEEKPKPFINFARTKSLAKFYKKISSRVAFSMESGLILNRNNKFYFIKTIYNKDSINSFSLDLTYSDKLVSLYEIKSMSNKTIVRNDGIKELFTPQDRLFYIEVNKKEALNQKYFFWEYFFIH